MKNFAIALHGGAGTITRQLMSPEEEKHLLTQAAGHFCNPPVRLFFKELEDEGKTVLKVIIPESAEKPHLVKVKENDWRKFIRINDETVQTSLRPAEESEEEKKEEILPEYEPQEKMLLDFLGRNQRITLKQYMKLVNISRQHAHHILVRMVLQGVIRLHQNEEREDYYTLKAPAGFTRSS